MRELCVSSVRTLVVNLHSLARMKNEIPVFDPELDYFDDEPDLRELLEAQDLRLPLESEPPAPNSSAEARLREDADYARVREAIMKKVADAKAAAAPKLPSKFPSGLTAEDIEESYRRFRRPPEIQLADDLLRANESVSLSQARCALQISAVEMSRRLGLSQPGYLKLEAREETGSVTIADLKSAAEAMNCRLKVQVRPKDEPTFSRLIWRTTVKVAQYHPYIAVTQAQNKMKSLSWKISDLLMMPKFRREHMMSRSRGV